MTAAVVSVDRYRRAPWPARIRHQAAIVADLTAQAETLRAELAQLAAVRAQAGCACIPAAVRLAQAAALEGTDPRTWPDEVLRLAHTQHRHHGNRDPWAVTGEREYQRRRKAAARRKDQP